MCKKDYIWNPATCSYKNGKCLASIVDNSVIRCDEVIKETKTATTKFTEKKNAIYETKNFNILLAFLLITIALLITVSIYCYLIKYKSKQKHLLPYYVINDKLINVL